MLLLGWGLVICVCLESAVVAERSVKLPASSETDVRLEAEIRHLNVFAVISW